MITHNKISTIPNGTNTDLVMSSDWNDGHIISKIASDNLRNSHDNETNTYEKSYYLLKTITLNQKLYGTIRIKFDMRQLGGDIAYGKLYHNGVALGSEQSTFSTDYVTFSEDITHDFETNNTIELYGYIPDANMFVRNFRLYYDNADIITISTTNS